MSSLRITIEHSAYYQRVPVTESQVFDDTPPEDAAEDWEPRIPKGMVPLSETTESTFPGFRMYRSLVNAPTTSTTDVDLDSLASINDGREAAGLAAQPTHLNLVKLLTEAAWRDHFPLDSITKITTDDPKWTRRLAALFEGDDD